MRMMPDNFVSKTYICRRTEQAAGKLPAEFVWNEAVLLWPLLRQPENAAEKYKAHPAAREQTACWMLWDDNFLYVSAQLMCEEYFALPEAPTWESDVFELFFRLDTESPYYEFHANVDGRVWAASYSGIMGDGQKLMETGWELCEQAREPDYWKVILRLPWKVMPGKVPRSGDEWRFNLARQNYGTGFKYDAKQRGNAVRGCELSCSAAWAEGFWAFHDCAHFDILKFE
jgi:hypothetical protein